MDFAFWLSVFVGCGSFLALAIYAAFKYYTGNKKYWPNHGMEFLDLDHVVPFMDRVSFKIPFHIVEAKMYEECKRRSRVACGVMEFRKPILVLTDLDLIKRVTVKDFDHFVNRRSFTQVGKDEFSKDMLLFKEDSAWRELRSTLSPTFSTGKIKRMFEVFADCAGKMIRFLEEETQKSPNGSVDVRDCTTRYTIDVIASAAFGVDSQLFKDKNAPFSSMATRLRSSFSGLKIIKLFLAVFVPKLLNLLKISLSDEEALNFFADIIRSTIKQREESGEIRNDFVQLLIEAKAEKPESTKTPLTDDLILSQALLFFFAGFDTVETLIIFAIYELGLNPDVQDRLSDEVEAAFAKNGGKTLDYEQITHMQYLDMVISETLRKYPPAVRTERQCTQDYQLPNTDYVVKKGDLIMIPMYGIHHDKEYFPNPEKFDPERFTAENVQQRHPYSYFPFGTGPRNCIAMRFALIEGKTALAHLVHSFKIDVSEKTDIPIKVGRVTGFKPDGELWMKLTKRNTSEE